MPKGRRSLDAAVLDAAASGKALVQNDCWAISATTKKPVLAHLFLNHIIDEQVAYDNFLNFTGYQPPQNSITGDDLVAKGVIPKNWRASVEAGGSRSDSLQLMALTAKGQALWQSAYAKFNSGV